MSVSVQNLSKFYGQQAAVNQVSFEAKKGEILGFLGPNGAGKTTTMKIITCYVPQTEGEVTVCGYDVRAEPIEVRRKVGYLPEHNPLYKEMYVREYLDFTAQIYKLSNRKSRIDEMIEKTGLEREQKKLIGALSKGYRQRVGIAQAMIHDPEVLILDEPTSGLDPNQLVDIRNLIRSIGEEKTVIFSTHIMQEVQALCDRVLIINQGNLVANDTIDTLQRRVQGDKVTTVAFQQKVRVDQLERIAGITEVTALGNDRFSLVSKQNTDIRPDVFRFAVEKNLILIELHQETRSVENVFQALTR